MGVANGGRPPRAVIHQRILDTAEDEPETSIEGLAAEIPGASPDLVERVLEEYGDPGEDVSTHATSAAEDDAAPTVAPDAATEDADTQIMDTEQPGEDASRSAETDEGGARSPDDLQPPEAVELTAKQRRALEAISEHLDATQAELAEHLGVSSATVNKRVNAIEGFDWSDRWAFAAAVLGEETLDRSSEVRTTSEPPPTERVTSSDGTEASSSDAASTGSVSTGTQAASDGGQLHASDPERAVEELRESVGALEARLEEASVAEGDAAAGGAASTDGPKLDETLLAKTIRAVLADESISEEEELRVLEALL